MAKRRPKFTPTQVRVGWASVNLGADIDNDAVELGNAVRAYASRGGRRPEQIPAPVVLRIAKGLGWRKVAYGNHGD